MISKFTIKIINKYICRKIPIAWLQLSHKKTRLLVALIGIAFADILMFTQLGLRSLLFDGITLVPENLNGDLYLISAYAQNIGSSSFPKVYLYQANAIAGVASASPLYIGSAEWVNTENIKSSTDEKSIDVRKAYKVRVLAFNPQQPVFILPEINQQLDLLTIPKNVLFDRLGQPQLGKITQLFIQDGEVITIMNNRMIRIAGLFNMGSTVFDQGHVVMSDWNYGIQNGNNILKKISVGILTLEQGVSKKTIIDNIKKNLSKDVKAVSKEELMQIEQNYIAQFPEGKILNFGVAIGFIVGVVVVYQVLYTDVSEHLSEYATLKAIGYSDRFLLKIVLQEAIILGIVGFIPSFFISYGVYNFLESNTKIPLQMSFDIIVKVFILTIFMCCFSGFIAIKKLSDSNPADIF